MTNLKQKITDLRNSVAVDGKPLVEEGWSDQQVADQITILLKQKEVPESELQDQMGIFLIKEPSDLPLKEAVEAVKAQIHTLVGWHGLPEPEIPFWKNFGSAPYTLEGNGNPKLDPDKGHRGMDEIFDDKFKDGHTGMLNVHYFLSKLEERIKEQREAIAERRKIYSSTYASLDEIEETLPLKKAREAARVFWLDKTKPMEERIKAFNAHGEKKEWLHHPKHAGLHKIFDIFIEDGDDYRMRRETINCFDVIEWWIDALHFDRLHIDYSRNPYHPSLKKSERNYSPSEKSMERLSAYYQQILFVEGVTSFVYDW